MKTSEQLQQIREQLFPKLMLLYKSAGVGHIGSSLSCFELLIQIYHGELRDIDLCILSKGHAAGALYVVLDSVGQLGYPLDSFYKDGTVLAAHPPCTGKIPAIPFGTGSLGHGLSLACGIALGAKLKGEDRRVYCILSDGDCNEGSVWEAFHFAAQHCLDNLVVVLDLNGLQGFGFTDKVLKIEPMAQKLALVGFQVENAKNGNSFSDVGAAFERFKGNSQKPKCLVAHTTKGHSVSYMEDKMEWHYLPMSDSQYQMALLENEPAPTEIRKAQ